MRIPAVRLLPRAILRAPRIPRAIARHWRRKLILLTLLAAALTAGYMFWLRDSSLVRVEHVSVEGISTAPDAGRLRADLAMAAKTMTTLHPDVATLRRVAAGNPVVHSIEVTTDFPHGMTIHVTENRAVALLSAGDQSVPVAGDGTLLAGVEMHGSLPEVRTMSLPDGKRLATGGALDRVAAAAAAPRALLARVTSITIQPGKGLVVQLENGPAIWLGGAVRLDLKWSAAASVLAQESSQGASYIDVRIPERAVAGGLGITDQAQPDPTYAAPVDPTTAPQGTPAPAAPAATVPQTAPTPATPPAATQQPAPAAQTPVAPTTTNAQP